MIEIKKHKTTQVIMLTVLMSLLSFMTQAFTTIATPAAPATLVNHILKQCAERVMLGDECYYCTPTEGWEILGFEQQCPSGYTKTDKFVWSCAAHTPPSTPYSQCGGAYIALARLTPASVNSESSLIATARQDEAISSVGSDTALYAGLAVLIVVVGGALAILIRKKAS